MPNAGDIKPESRLFAMFIGKYDSGKSTAAASFPGTKYFLDFDERIDSLRGRKDVDFDKFSSTNTGFKEADKQLEILNAKSRAPNFPYSLVCFDSLSMGRVNLLYDAMKFTSGFDDPKQKGGRKIGELYLPTTQDYGYEAEAIKQIVYDGLKPLKCHVVVTGHCVDRYKTVQEKPGAPMEQVLDGEEIYGDRKLIAYLPIMFNEIYYFKKEIDASNKVRRFVVFDNSVARTTYPQLKAARRIEITDKSFYSCWSEILKEK